MANAGDELGISEAISANPIQAALTSAVTFATDAARPNLVALVAPRSALVPSAFGASLGVLALLGAKVGGADVLKPTARGHHASYLHSKEAP